VLAQADLEAFFDAPADAADPPGLGKGGRFRSPAAAEGQLTGGGVLSGQQAAPAAVVESAHTSPRQAQSERRSPRNIISNALRDANGKRRRSQKTPKQR